MVVRLETIMVEIERVASPLRLLNKSENDLAIRLVLGKGWCHCTFKPTTARGEVLGHH